MRRTRLAPRTPRAASACRRQMRRREARWVAFRDTWPAASRWHVRQFRGKRHPPAAMGQAASAARGCSPQADAAGGLLSNHSRQHLRKRLIEGRAPECQRDMKPAFMFRTRFGSNNVPRRQPRPMENSQPWPRLAKGTFWLAAGNSGNCQIDWKRLPSSDGHRNTGSGKLWRATRGQVASARWTCGRQTATDS